MAMSSVLNRSARVVLLLLALVVLGGFVVLANWDIPPPAAAVEKVLPDDRLPK